MNTKLLTSLVLIWTSLACSMGGIIPQVLRNSSSGWMCFESGKDIWVVGTDGSQLQNITNTDSIWESGCKLSWDANKVIYTDRDDNLYLINRNGTGKRILLENEGVSYPSWAPDGTKIIYVQMNVQDGNPITSVYILDIASNEKAKIHESSPGAIFSPVISPDGKSIAFSSGGVYTMDLDGSNVEQILQPFSDESAFFLAWSRDGRKIAFSTTSHVPYGADTWVEYGNIYVMNSDGSGLTNLTNSAPDPSAPLNPGKNIFKFGSLPCWTHGDQIVFLSNMESHSYTEKPYIMNSDGTSVKLLIDQEMSGLDYQPDTRENSTAVPTVDISTAIRRTKEDATATAQAIEFSSTSTAQANNADCQNSINIPVNVVGWRTIECDAFDTDNGNWWTGSRDNDYLIGTRSIKHGEYQWEINSKKGFVDYSTTSADFPDFLVTITTHVESNADAAAGISFRHGDTGKYIFLIKPNHQTYTISYNLNGKWVKIVNWTDSSAIHENDTNQLTVLGQGKEYTVYINGKEVDHFSNDLVTGGKVGMAAELFSENVSATFYFDNFLLLAP